MKQLILLLEISAMTFFILLAFFIGVMAGWQSANSAKTAKPQVMTLRKVGE